MSTSNLSLWINPQNNTIISGWNSLTQSPQIVLTQGDDVFVDIHMVDFSGGESIEIPFPLGANIKCAIGRLDRFPTEGNFVFEYGLDSVTIPIASSILDVNNLINSMPSIIAEGGVTIYFVNSTTYRIVFNTTGSKQGCSVDASGLYPSSTATVAVITGGSSSINEVQHVKLKATPVAYSDTFTLAGTPSISIQELTTSIFRISISDILKYGNFTISNGTKTTAAISWSASGSEILSALTLAGISTTSGVVGSVQYSVTKNDTLSWDISRISGSYESLSVSPIGFIGFSTMTGALNMNTIEVEDLLGGAARVAAILEVEMTAGPLKQTLYQGSINIANDLIDNASYSPIQFPTGDVIPEAPIDNNLYARKNGNWEQFQEEDNQGITQTFADGRYAQLSTGYATESWVASQNYITSSALAGYATESWVSGLGYLTISDYPINAVTSSYYYNYGTSLSLSGEITYYDGFLGFDVTVPYTITTPSGSDYSGWTVTLDDSYSVGYINISGTSVTLGCNASTMQEACNALSSGVSGWMFTMSGSPYAPSSVLSTIIGPFTIPQTTLIDSPEQSFVIRGAMLKTITDEAKAQFAYNKVLATDSAGVAYFTDEYALLSSLYEYMPLSGGSFSGKINLPSRSTTSQAGFLNLGTCSDGVLSPSGTLIEGDVYFFDNNVGAGSTEIKIGYSAKNNLGVVTHFGVPALNQYNVFTNSNVIQSSVGTTIPALRVTQLGTGHSIVVEDSTSPDADATIIDASGNVGIGVSNASGGWTADAKLAVKGSTTSTLLRLTQLGTGNVLLVEDEASTDATAFVIGADGRVGIGGAVSGTSTNKIAVYGGNIIISSGYGVIFGGGSTQTVPYIPSAVAITGGTIDNIIIDGGTF